jgi:CRISPR-associated endonuclease/helicase Cas3
LTGDLKQALSALCSEPDAEKIPLAISTLRGQFADNREWSADPSRPAIIVGTVDMIGSRLLFSGYGVGFKSKPLHAGFLGQDVLLVHDEAHLEHAFQELLVAIQKEQERCNEFRQFRVMELSATSRGENVFALTDADRSNPVVKKRIQAKKIIQLHKNVDEKKLPEELAELALSHKESNCAVIVFVRTVEAVERIAEKLRKSGQKVETLTGTLRGKERDELVNYPIFGRFQPKPDPGEETVYLVCTSAGEVGVNISGDHLVCDLSTFESMAQRFGRVNRFGQRYDTRVDIVFSKVLDGKDPYESRLLKTLALIRGLNGDGSPDALSKLNSDERLAAFSPTPTILPTSDILFDAWALTSIKGKLPGRPPVEPYLHGLSEWEPPETHVAWREEVDNKDKLFGRYEPEDLLEDYPIKPHELLRDRSDRVFKHLVFIAERHPEQDAWLLDDDGTVERFLLKNLADKDKKDRIQNRTILLPPSVGGLQKGLLDGKSDNANDVADEWLDENGKPRRQRKKSDELPSGMRLIRTLDTNPDAEEDSEDDSRERYWYWFVKPRSADDDGSKMAEIPIRWQHHTTDVETRAKKFANLLLKDHPDLQLALVLAARFHDLGKRRIKWQRSIGNPKPEDWHAKSGKAWKSALCR